MSVATDKITPSPRAEDATVFIVILAISFCHLLNDMMQALLPAIYPHPEKPTSISASRQIGLDYIGLSNHGVPAAAG